MNKVTRNEMIKKANSVLEAVEGMTKKELASGASFFLTQAEKRTRIAKIVYTGRLEINVKLSEEAVTKLSSLDFQDWSNKPRSGVSYYGPISNEALEIIRAEFDSKIQEMSKPAEQTAEDLSSIWPIVEDSDEVSPEPELEDESAQEAEEISAPEVQLEADKPKAKGRSRKSQPKKKAA